MLHLLCFTVRSTNLLQLNSKHFLSLPLEGGKAPGSGSKTTLQPVLWNTQMFFLFRPTFTDYLSVTAKKKFAGLKCGRSLFKHHSHTKLRKFSCMCCQRGSASSSCSPTESELRRSPSSSSSLILAPGNRNKTSNLRINVSLKWVQIHKMTIFVGFDVWWNREELYTILSRFF